MSWKKPRYLNDDIDNLRKEILENPSEDKLQYLEYLLHIMAKFNLHIYNDIPRLLNSSFNCS